LVLKVLTDPGQALDDVRGGFGGVLKSMYSFSGLIAALLIAASVTNVAPVGTEPRRPVLLELFTSEGCSSCPPADALLQKLDRTQPIAGVDLIVLSEHVDYWNALGWKDPFSSTQFTERQTTYAQQIDPASGTYTPELVVDGRAGVVGSDWGAVSDAIGHAAKIEPQWMSISKVSRSSGKVSIHIDAAATGRSGAALYVALADDYDSSHVLRGENQGRTLSHVAVVRELTFVGPATAHNELNKDVSLRIPDGAGAKGLRIVTFLQDQKTGAILSLASTHV